MRPPLRFCEFEIVVSSGAYLGTTTGSSANSPCPGGASFILDASKAVC